MPAIDLCLAILLTSAAQPAGDALGAFAYPDTETARQHWQPQFGSLPVRVEKLGDGTTCLAVDAEFAKAQDRACWDWKADLDLSQAGLVVFDVRATGGELAGTVGMYFGTERGWYAQYAGPGLPGEWAPIMLPIDAFGTEGEPDGWDKVKVFRFSVWSTGAGKMTCWLRNMRVLPKSERPNLLKNGSFEILGPSGMPYGWGSGHWGVGDLPWAANMDLWRAHWHADTTVARHGSTSLLLDNTEDLPLLRAVSVWVSPAERIETLTASVWAKSDRDALPVVLQVGSASTRAEVGRDWVQIVLTGIKRDERMILVVAPQEPGKLWLDCAALQEGDGPTEEYVPAVRDGFTAVREAGVDWSPPTRTAQVAAGRSISGPVTAARVEIDRYGRFLLDGAPYVQHSLGLEFVSDLDILDFVARSGFRDVCIQLREGLSTEDLRGIFDRCAQVGLRIIPWLDGRIPRDRFAEHIRALKEHPALLCWYVYDEPSGDGFEEANARLSLAKELDPAHPAFINYLSNKLEGHLGDIYSTDVYPIPHSGVMAAINAVARMKAAAETEVKPVWMWLQGTGYAYWMDREPSPRELSCMVYGSLIKGARGIYYFAQVPRTKECWDEMRALCVEVDAVAPALYSLDAAPEATSDEAAVLCEAYARGEEVWVLAVNTLGRAVEASLAVPGMTGDVEVAFEGRTVRAADGAWRDGFGPYERHVYRAGGAR